MVVFLQPFLGTFNEFIEPGCAGVANEGGSAFAVLDPEHGVATVGKDGNLPTFLLAEGKGMNDGEKLTDVVRPIDRTEMKDFRGGTEMHAAIFHLSRIARAGSLDGDAGGGRDGRRNG